MFLQETRDHWNSQLDMFVIVDNATTDCFMSSSTRRDIFPEDLVNTVLSTTIHIFKVKDNLYNNIHISASYIKTC